MVQMDGSHHDWLEGRGPKLVLMGYIDDATSTVEARFYDHEGTVPALDSFRSWVERYGIPCSVYLDKHTTYRSPQTPTVEEQLQGHDQSQSQFQRAMSELGVEVIHAHSPAAKGRIERLFQTLQDRLVKELRLAGASTLAEANQVLERYLPLYNQRFRVAGGSADGSASSGAGAAGSGYGAVSENATAAQCRFHGPARRPSLPGRRSPQSPNGDGPPASGRIDPSALPQPFAELSIGAATAAQSATDSEAGACQDNSSPGGRAPLARLLQTAEA